MLVDSNTVILKQSRSFGSLGGDILRSEEELHGLERYRFNVNSEDAFFNSVIYKGYYIKNNSTQTIKNISLTISGGLVSPIPSTNVPSNEIELRNVLDNRSIVRYTYPEIEDSLFERYKNGEGPYLPSRQEMDELMSSGISERTAFERWLVNYLYLTGHTRQSVFNQVSASVMVSSKRILSTFENSGVGKSIDLNSLVFKDSNLRANLPVDLGPGEYWGFYVKFETKFKPTQYLLNDLCVLHINWQELDNQMHISQPVRFEFETEFQQMLDLQNLSLDRLYSKYPPFFMNYLDVEDSS